ncbi:MAG: bifunctional proline dehydrogenase/L-glutamate gamma-semialdehyde dehydrogenase PutA, partial [Betaproteobacteria bacterium]
HPRYSYAQRARTMTELYPRLVELSQRAARFAIGLNIDAEEADRLELSLDLLEKLCFEPALKGWNGIGFVVQAYQKRCPYVLDYLIDLARRSSHRLMVRLVKGAYWDSEIKRAQVEGLPDFPVYTRKVYTDVSYLACANQLLAAPDAIYPQFATHNAHTLAAIYRSAGKDFYSGQYEFQCLHGMGEPLYSRVIAAESDGGLGRPCRIYAPVGTHETLLAYLVRRLLENGANTSFVNRIADETISIAELVADPVATVEQMVHTEGAIGLPHPAINLPRDLFGTDRRNSTGIDLNNQHELAALSATLSHGARRNWIAAPMVGDDERLSATPASVLNPADRRDRVGDVFAATEQDISDALAASVTALPAWRATSSLTRADTLTHTADLMEAQMPELIGLIVREAGKTIASAIGEVREAADFLRYYAAQVRREFGNDTYRPLGVVVCISPWNFPLSIFTGQVAAALVAGNTVIAKPAEQTPLVAAEAVRLLRRAGVPVGAVQLLPGRGETVGAALVADARIRAVVFTGSTQVARALQKNLSGRLDEYHRPLTLIAETGGLNAMIVDSSALAEQVVADAIKSAFDSAGQRCSALRVLCVQEDLADRVLEMLLGALHEQRVGEPDRLDTDVGPVIDDEAKQTIEAHVIAMKANGRAVHRFGVDENQHGSFVAPTLVELNHIDELEREVFGPVLHFVRYRSDALPALIDQINATGYGLTLGVHTRIDETIDFIVERAHVGNQYVNRNMIGAVVGVQPFGGEGLSGTGPKAGGPLYLRRLLSAAPVVSIAGLDGDLEFAVPADRLAALHALRTWLASDGETELAACCDTFAATSPVHVTITLPGPTGERNTYTLVPREAVLCLATDRGDLLFQLACVFAADS